MKKLILFVTIVMLLIISNNVFATVYGSITSTSYAPCTGQSITLDYRDCNYTPKPVSWYIGGPSGTYLGAGISINIDFHRNN